MISTTREVASLVLAERKAAEKCYETVSVTGSTTPPIAAGHLELVGAEESVKAAAPRLRVTLPKGLTLVKPPQRRSPRTSSLEEAPQMASTAPGLETSLASSPARKRAVRLSLDPSTPPLLGETYTVRVRPRPRANRGRAEGVTYHVQVVLPPDNAPGIQITCGPTSDGTRVLHVELPAAGGAPTSTPGETAVDVFFYSQRGLQPIPRRMQQEPAQGHFSLSLLGAPHFGPAEVRFTIVARTPAGELRKTRYLRY